MNVSKGKSQVAMSWGILVLALMAVAFDAMTPLGVAAGVVYVPLVLCSLWVKGRYTSFIVAGAATVLTVAAYFLLDNYAADNRIVVINRLLSLVAIWTAALLIYWQKLSGIRLMNSRERQKSLIDNLPTGLALFSSKGELLQINPAFSRILGHSQEVLSNKNFNTFAHPEDSSIDAELLGQLNSGDISSYEVEKRYIHRNGSTVTCQLCVQRLQDPSAGGFYFVNHLIDVSDRKAAQGRLSATLDFQKLVLDTIPDYVFVKDAELRIVQANKAFLGAYPEEKRDKVIGYTTLEDYPPEEVELFTRNDREALATGFHETEESIRFPGGATKTLFTKKTRFTDDEDTYVLGVARDITALKNVQRELEKANEELEMFSYIASHDLKAPLRAIENLSQWIYEDLKDVMTEDTAKHIRLLQSRVNRLKVMLNDILEYSRVGRIQEASTSVDTNMLVQTIFDSSDHGEGFQLHIDGNLPVLDSPRTPLEQVFSNLITNAVKHHDRTEGTVTISFTEAENFIEFTVADDGPGIAEEFQEKIFVMFQTLKPRDVTDGSGLGMSIVRKLVEWQGGTVWVESNDEHRGCKFKFTWPRTSSSTEKST